jgi:hypothetical protein
LRDEDNRRLILLFSNRDTETDRNFLTAEGLHRFKGLKIAARSRDFRRLLPGGAFACTVAASF